MTYGTYLQLDGLLALQTPRSEPAEHDEMLFIVIHQVYELWFKQVLHELGRVERSFDAGDGAAAQATFKRILTILKTLVAQVDVLESMTPIEFGSFRARLQSASGFQSLQFR
ncbi:MAG TPA: tryptophan 2,3-dioxygenase family protein, partial [Polyangia bacterium]